METKIKVPSEVIDEVILTHAEKLLIYYANEYKERPKSLISSFLKFNSIRMAASLVVFACKKNGMLDELKGKKNFEDWVSRQPLEERWKPTLSNFLLIIWGVNK